MENCRRNIQYRPKVCGHYFEGFPQLPPGTQKQATTLPNSKFIVVSEFEGLKTEKSIFRCIIDRFLMPIFRFFEIFTPVAGKKSYSFTKILKTTRSVGTHARFFWIVLLFVQYENRFLENRSSETFRDQRSNFREVIRQLNTSSQITFARGIHFWYSFSVWSTSSMSCIFSVTSSSRSYNFSARRLTTSAIVSIDSPS